MSSLYKIIKSTEVRDNLLQVLPLRKSSQGGQAGDRGGESRDVLANFQAWALAQAEETISRARATADEILRQAQLESEEIKRLAYQRALEQGLGEGREKGYREGLARAEEEGQALRAQAREVLAQAEEYRRRTIDSLEPEIVDLAREIAERLLSTHLALDPGAVLQVAAESIRLVSDRQSIVLYVNPSEADLVKSKKEQIQNILPPRASVHVMADAAISPGGCLVETEQGLVDATLERRKAELLRALYGGE